jgi:hypothetical protein
MYSCPHADSNEDL